MAKILMVEDDARLASQIAEYLELQQHSVEICGDGRDASDLLKVGAFDLVMLDWDLPHRSGIEVLR
jgi:DNA-binding response OmpR family regulator